MLANRYTNQQNDLSQREQHMRDGTLFDVYQYRLSTYASGAQKMMALRSFNGMLSIHVFLLQCVDCDSDAVRACGSLPRRSEHEQGVVGGVNDA